MVGISAINTNVNELFSAPKVPQKTKDMEKAQEAAEEFEAFFLAKAMESMYEGVSTEGIFGGGHAEKIYRSFLVNEYGKAMAKTGTVGVADEVMRSIIQLQEAQSSM